MVKTYFPREGLPKDIVIASILLALFADTKMINLIVLAANPSLSGSFMTAMYFVVVAGLFLMGLIQHRRISGFTPSHILISIFCCFCYLLTITFVAPPSVSVSFFGIFTVAAFLIPGIVKINAKLFILALFLFPSIGVFYLDQIILSSIILTTYFTKMIIKT